MNPGTNGKVPFQKSWLATAAHHVANSIELLRPAWGEILLHHVAVGEYRWHGRTAGLSPPYLMPVLRGSPLEGLTDPGAARGDDLFVDVRLGSSGPFRHDKRMVTLSNHMHRYRYD